MARQNVGNGIDLFAREGFRIDNWVETLFNEAIREYDSLNIFEERQLKDERLRNKKKASRAKRKKAQPANVAVSTDLVPEKKTFRNRKTI